MTYGSISICKLSYLFPGFIWWEADHELCGINFETKQQICIEDGACWSEDGTWIVSGYNLETIPDNWRKLKWNSSEDMFVEHEKMELVWNDQEIENFLKLYN